MPALPRAKNNLTNNPTNLLSPIGEKVVIRSAPLAAVRRDFRTFRSAMKGAFMVPS
jgi:hypothetical protein